MTTNYTWNIDHIEKTETQSSTLEDMLNDLIEQYKSAQSRIARFQQDKLDIATFVSNILAQVTQAEIDALPQDLKDLLIARGFL